MTPKKQGETAPLISPDATNHENETEEEIFTWDHLARAEEGSLWGNQTQKPKSRLQQGIWTSTLAVLSISLIAVLLLAGNSGSTPSITPTTSSSTPGVITSATNPSSVGTISVPSVAVTPSIPVTNAATTTTTTTTTSSTTSTTSSSSSSSVSSTTEREDETVDSPSDSSSESNIEPEKVTSEETVVEPAPATVEETTTTTTAIADAEPESNVDVQSPPVTVTEPAETESDSTMSASVVEDSSGDQPVINVVDPDAEQISTEKIMLLATNEYGPWKAAKDYPWMKDIEGTQLVEPYKQTQLELSGAVVEEDPDYTYKWQIPDYPEQSDLGDLSKTGSKITVVFKTLGIYSLTVSVMDTTGKTRYQFHTRIVCKYVKRELRTLTLEDREKVLDAMAALWNNRQDEGKAKYGPGFTSIDVLVAVHSMASNDVMCDGFHEGTGFISSHLALTNTFEQSMRAVDPTVTLPYWDFTIEGEKVKRAGRKPSYMKELTPVFDEDWFGQVDPISNAIVNGRWKDAKMPRQEDLKIGVQNSYGYVRSYWNNNPDPGISRRLFDACGIEPVHKQVPNCQNHYDVLNCKNLGCFQATSPADGHGPMHVHVGGMWGSCSEGYWAYKEKWDHILMKNYTDADILAAGYKKWKWGYEAPGQYMLETAIMGEYFHIYRSFWRSHMCAVDGTPKYLICPENCSEDTPFEECTCQVDALVNGETDWKNLWPCVLNSQENRDFFASVYTEEMMEDMTYWLATASVQEGEMIESASTADPIFWITHPVIERLLAAKRLPEVTLMGAKSFEKWPTGFDGNNETWFEYSYYTFGVGENKGYPDISYRCSGHGADDPIPNGLQYTPAMERIVDRNGDGEVSNWEFYLALDPNVIDGNDYVFDHFEWPHCA